MCPNIFLVILNSGTSVSSSVGKWCCCCSHSRIFLHNLCSVCIFSIFHVASKLQKEVMEEVILGRS